MRAVDAATHLNDLCSDLVASIQTDGTTIALTTDIDCTILPTDRAISIGLIVNELTVADDGKGIDPQRARSALGSGWSQASPNSFGRQPWYDGAPDLAAGARCVHQIG